MFTKVLLVSMALFAVSQAIVCPPNFCRQVTCPPMNKALCESMNGVFQPKGGFCGCCDHCPTKLGEGDVCHLHLHGLPPTAACAEGFRCDFSSLRCVIA